MAREGKEFADIARGGFSEEAASSLRVLFSEEQNRLDLTIVSTISALMPALQTASPEVIFLDLALARMDSVVEVYMMEPREQLVGKARAVRSETATPPSTRYGFRFVEKTGPWVLD